MGGFGSGFGSGFAGSEDAAAGGEDSNAEGGVITTANDLITRALRLLNVVDAVNLPGPEMLQNGLTTLNEMVDAWALERKIIHYDAENEHELVAGQSVYTVGPGGDFDQVRPVWLPRWSLVLDRDAVPVIKIDRGRPLTIEEWRRISIQAITGTYPTALYYDRANTTAGLGRIMIWPVPSTGTADIVLWTPTPLEAFADLATSYSFAQGYVRALRYNLAVELALDYPGALTDKVEARAIDAKAWVKRANFRLPLANFDAALVGRRGGRTYNIYTDD